MAERKTPKLRFKGFDDDWEEIVLNSISDRVTRKNTNNESTLPLTISAQYGLVDQRDFFNSQIASKDVSGYFLVRNGEFAYNKSFSSEYPFGAIKRLDFYDKGVLSTLYIVFSVKNINSDYLVSYYDSSYWHKEIIKIAAEGARNHGLLNVAPEDFFNTKLYVPKSESEQQQIGSFFKNLDQQILLTQEKLDKTKTLKKTMLQKMFPQEGSKVPEIRLEGFSGDWEEKKFGDIAKEYQIKTVAENEDILLSCAIEGIFLNSELFNHFRGSSTVGYLKIKKGDMILSAQNLHLGNANVNLRFDSGIISPAYKVYDLSNVDKLFFSFWLKREDTKNFFLSVTTEGASLCRKNIDWNLLLQKNLFLPKTEQEQQSIGFFLQEFDSLISTQSQKLDLLKTLKKSLLEKMFV